MGNKLDKVVLKVVLPFDHVTNVMSRDNLKKLYHDFHKNYGH